MAQPIFWADVQQWLNTNPVAAAQVTLIGSLPHAELEDIYNSADLFLLGSHQESCGYAVLEALACGVMPVVTDIPSFRVLTGNGSVGGLWPVGNADALARVLKNVIRICATPQQEKSARSSTPISAGTRWA